MTCKRQRSVATPLPWQVAKMVGPKKAALAEAEAWLPLKQRAVGEVDLLVVLTRVGLPNTVRTGFENTQLELERKASA